MIYNAWVQAGSPLMTAAVEDQSLLSIRPVLYPNIPNPLKGSTTIRYSVPENMDVQLYIKNAEGIMIEAVWKGFRTTGEYTFEWQPENLPEGIYLLIFHAGNFVEVKKLILLNP